MQLPQLCGGVFFETILAHKKPSSKRGLKDPLSQNNVLMDLIHVTYPAFPRPNENTLKSITSSYRRCRRNVVDALPFKRPSYVTSFQGQMENSYPVLLYRMDRFLDKIVGIKNRYQLGNMAKMLLEVIEHDNIEALQIGQFGAVIHLSELKEVYIQSFMLGVWFYIIEKGIENKIDTNVYDTWTRSQNRRIVLQHDVNYTIQEVSEASVMEGTDGETNDYVEETRFEGFSSSFSEEKTVKVEEDIIEKNSNSSGFQVHIFIQTPFASYLNKMKKRYSEVKTLLFGDTPHQIESFFVCNDICAEIQKANGGWTLETIHDATAQALYDVSRYVIVQGTGGLGKTMMLKHFLLRAIKDYTFTYILPIFINLREFENSDVDFFKFIYSQIESILNSSKEELQQLMKTKRVLLLLDGLDEMKSMFYIPFQKQLSAFIDSYPEVQIIMSSRPFSKFIEYGKFTVANLCPFSKEQSLELIDRLDYPIDEPHTREKFKQELNNRLYTTHQGFVDNPLLLTIMLKTYKKFAKIPTTLYKFYENAYSVLSTEHDATKETYSRTLKTGLNADQFHTMISQFSALSYTDERFEFSKNDIEKYMQRMVFPDVPNIQEKITRDNFIYDLCYSICLMYDEGDTYHFLHRTFQEYFCAAFFSKQLDEELFDIASTYFEKRSCSPASDSSHYLWDVNETFGMLYDMIPEKIERFVFLPKLEELFKKCDEEKGYWTFLQIMYETIPYSKEDIRYSLEAVSPSFIFNFIIARKGFCHYTLDDMLEPVTWSLPSHLVINEFVDQHDRLISVDMEDLTKEPCPYPELRAYLEDDTCPYYVEYTKVYDYYLSLKKKNSKAINSDDLMTRLLLFSTSPKKKPERAE